MTKFVESMLGEVCEDSDGIIQTGPFGSQLHQSDYSDTGIPVVMPADIKNGRIDESRIVRVSEGHVERLRRHRLEVGDIVYGRRGDIGRQAIIRHENEGWLCGTGCLRLSLGENPKLVPEYLHLYLSMPEVIGWIQNQAIGATMPNLNTQILKRVPLIFPEDLDAQKRIVAVVAAYDDLIENNKRRITLLEKMAEEIYREWFVRFRFPGWQEAEFEKGLPVGWSSDRISRFLKVLSGGTPKSSKAAYWGGHEGIPFFTPKDAPQGFYVFDAEKHITESGLASCNSRLYKKDTIFITARGTVGKLGLAARDMAMNQSCYALVPQDDRYHCFHFLTLKYLLPQIKGISKSGVFDNIVVDTFDLVSMLMPATDILRRFQEIIGPMFSQLEALMRSIEVLEKTKNQLLPRLISGKLSVENLDIQYPPSMQSDKANSSDEAAA